ncbi:hypothetical protein [Aureivirga sp. CE67]|uniref:hypothetical protein n=1 Tax=Aureivirga sp. CE67 TaxID=1788983 RepID=UPI0018CB87D4|nr:hypothetical protein [Aureivirga sp. CE67]
MKKLQQIANWKIILPLFIFFGIFNFYLFPKYQQIIDEQAHEPIVILDALFDYGKSDVDNLLEAMGEEGRKTYLFMSGIIDSVYPLIYGFLFFFIILNLTKKMENKAYLLAVLPIIAVFFDYIENKYIIKLINKYPNYTSHDVEITSMLTQGKWIFVFLSVVTILILFLTKIILFLKKEN